MLSVVLNHHLLAPHELLLLKVVEAEVRHLFVRAPRLSSGAGSFDAA